MSRQLRRDAALPPRARRGKELLAAGEELADWDCGTPPRGVCVALGWRTPTVLALARHIRDRHDVAVLPILADALEEAGCADDAILKHCRDSGGHHLGCWVVDLLLRGR